MVRIMPRPFSAKDLGYITSVIKKAREAKNLARPGALRVRRAQGARHLLERPSPRDERHDPGEDAKFDEKFSAWLRDSSVWVPLKVLLKAKPEDLVAAGYPEAEVKAFLTAYHELEQAEDRSPGPGRRAAAAATMLASSRKLGEAVNPTKYPTVAMIERETHFNAMNPFWQAPYRLRRGAGASGREPGVRGGPEDRSRGGSGQGVYLAGHARRWPPASPWRSTASTCGSGSRAGRR